MYKIINYLLSRADSVTAWIGFIGFGLLFLKLENLLEILFFALIVLPESSFSAIAKELSAKTKNYFSDKP